MLQTATRRHKSAAVPPLPLPELYSRVERHVPPIEWPILAEDIAAILKLKRETNAVDPGAQLPDAGHLPHGRRHRRRQPGAGARGGAHRCRRDRAGRRAFHGRDREAAEPGKNRADPRPRAGCSLAASITAADVRLMRAAPSRRADRDLRQHLGGGEGRERHLLHLGQRQEDRRGARRAEGHHDPGRVSGPQHRRPDQGRDHRLEGPLRGA